MSTFKNSTIKENKLKLNIAEMNKKIKIVKKGFCFFSSYRTQFYTLLIKGYYLIILVKHFLLHNIINKIKLHLKNKINFLGTVSYEFNEKLFSLLTISHG